MAKEIQGATVIEQATIGEDGVKLKFTEIPFKAEIVRQIADWIKDKTQVVITIKATQGELPLPQDA